MWVSAQFSFHTSLNEFPTVSFEWILFRRRMIFSWLKRARLTITIPLSFFNSLFHFILIILKPAQNAQLFTNCLTQKFFVIVYLKRFHFPFRVEKFFCLVACKNVSGVEARQKTMQEFFTPNNLSSIILRFASEILFVCFARKWKIREILKPVRKKEHD